MERRYLLFLLIKNKTQDVNPEFIISINNYIIKQDEQSC